MNPLSRRWAPLGALVLSHACLGAGDPVHGGTLYAARCAPCHSIDYNGVGPAHKGVFGRRAGQAPGYAYSPALGASGVVWTADNLDRWLTDPEALVPGQRMGVRVDEADQRADLIEYLKSLPARE